VRGSRQARKLRSGPAAEPNTPPQAAGPPAWRTPLRQASTASHIRSETGPAVRKCPTSQSARKRSGHAAVSLRAECHIEVESRQARSNRGFGTWRFYIRPAVSRYSYFRSQIGWHPATVLLLKAKERNLAATLL